jgi:recombination protein RecR
MNISSKLLSNAVDAFSSLPGIGKKSALRLALHILQQDKERVNDFCKAVQTMRADLRYCKVCHNLSDADICSICTSPSRQKNVICVVESIREAMAIENTQQFNGVYHVLGGLISPMEGISPNMLEIESLVERVKNQPNCELIMALSPTIEGETTIFYLNKQLEGLGANISTIARGVSFGGELEYADELTLGRSIVARIPYKNS